MISINVLANKQTGVGTLAISLMLLFLITIITLYTAKTTLVEQYILGNQIRSEQAFAAADAGLDFGRAWYNVANDTSELHEGNRYISDENGSSIDNGATYSNTSRKTSDDSDDTNDETRTEMFFCDPDSAEFRTDPENCTTQASESLSVGVVAIGYSADGTAKRVLTEELGNFGLVDLDGNGSAMSTKGAVGITGNVSVINRYTNTTIKSGKGVDIGNSATAATYIRNPSYDEDDLTDAELKNSDTGNAYTVESSGRNAGNNADILDNEQNYAGMDGDTFFQQFFYVTKSEMEDKATAAGQHVSGGNCSNAFDADSNNGITNSADATASGVFWVDGNCSINNSQVGSLDSPVIVIVDGEFSFKGEAYGLIYVITQYNAGGGGHIQGAIVVEGETVSGGGGTTVIIYDPDALKGAGGNPGGGGAVAGTWSDF